MELLGKLADGHLIVLRSRKIRISNRIRHLDERVASRMGQDGESGKLLNEFRQCRAVDHSPGFGEAQLP